MTERQRKDKHAEAFGCAHRHMHRSQEGHREVWSWKMSPNAFLSPPHSQWNGIRELTQTTVLSPFDSVLSSKNFVKTQAYPEQRAQIQIFLPQHPFFSSVTLYFYSNSISPEPLQNTLLCLITDSPPPLA